MLTEVAFVRNAGLKLRATQGKRIWILRTQVSGRKVDSGGIGQLLVAEIHAFEGNVRANNTVRSQIQTASGFFCSSDVKEIPNAFALESYWLSTTGYCLFCYSFCLPESTKHGKER
jgi:hypothetical protein